MKIKEKDIKIKLHRKKEMFSYEYLVEGSNAYRYSPVYGRRIEIEHLPDVVFFYINDMFGTKVTVCEGSTGRHVDVFYKCNGGLKCQLREWLLRYSPQEIRERINEIRKELNNENK